MNKRFIFVTKTHVSKCIFMCRCIKITLIVFIFFLFKLEFFYLYIFFENFWSIHSITLHDDVAFFFDRIVTDEWDIKKTSRYSSVAMNTLADLFFLLSILNWYNGNVNTWRILLIESQRDFEYNVIRNVIVNICHCFGLKQHTWYVKYFQRLPLKD
jgi:hypothetical protein